MIDDDDEIRLKKYELVTLFSLRDSLGREAKCGPTPCREACCIQDPAYHGRTLMLAQKGNPKYKHGEVHERCLECDLRERTLASIRSLKYELGMKT